MNAKELVLVIAVAKKYESFYGADSEQLAQTLLDGLAYFKQPKGKENYCPTFEELFEYVNEND